MKLYDGGKVIVGLVIFVALVTFPFWGNLGSAAYQRPELEKPAGQDKCIESVDFMRGEHMQMLNQWRDFAVRDGLRVYTATDGRQFNMSLSNTCLDCHKDQTKFCDRCHETMAVAPYCWDCHISNPKGNS